LKPCLEGTLQKWQFNFKGVFLIIEDGSDAQARFLEDGIHCVNRLTVNLDLTERCFIEFMSADQNGCKMVLVEGEMTTTISYFFP